MEIIEYKSFKIHQNTFHVPHSVVAHFNIERPLFLGKGGYGVVGHLNTVQSTRFPDIALKKFDNAFRKPKRAQRCYRELQLLSRIQHENIVKLIYAFSPDPSFKTLENVYLMTEYAGENLAALIRKETLTNHFYYLKDFKSMLTQLLTALQFLNSSKVIHRDLKPQNIAVKPNGKLTLLDFGLARVIDTDRDMTRNAGTLFYQSIETIPECNCRYDERADMWSVGAILCEMITGSILFEDRNPFVKAIQICGPVGNKVLCQINNQDFREYLEIMSEKSKRINIVDHLEKNGRRWIKKELKNDRKNIKSFLDLTLQFDKTERMTVNEALLHPFLREEGRIPLWNCIPLANSQNDQSEKYEIDGEEKREIIEFSDEEEIMIDNNEEEINYWRECIWKQLKTIPNPFK